ncbi:MAG: exodeoxyribonuclease V subunit gamma [Lachnospiraceae bacterium]|nr:exodeoxyribonuclease V subunit gamma [Lachnospiraceae bacterium]
MSLRFYFGPTDGELSRRIYEDVIARSIEHPEQNFLVVVPDQFTMQTQKALSTMHPRGGILNIDVLSFGRLSHRVLEEVDCREIPVLDDTGKCLVLQKLAENMTEELPVLGSFLRKQGYVREVKSAISEFMQYGLSTKDVEELIAFAGEKKALAGKLKDLNTIYEKFKDYIQDHFVTAEETMDILCKNLPKSNLLPGSVVILDGYTGFTPIQYRVLQEIAGLCDEMIITLVCGTEDSPYRLEGEQNLFYLTKKTVNDMERIAADANVERDRKEDVFVPDVEEDGELAFLRRHFFRYDAKKYEAKKYEANTVAHQNQAEVSGAASEQTQSATPATEQDQSEKAVQTQEADHVSQSTTSPQIRVSEMMNPAQEVRQTAMEIQRLIRQGTIAYRDIVIVTGDLEGYAPYVESEFGRLGIPCFIDRTRSITLNPLTEYMLSALNLTLKNFSYEAVFHYLRSGLAGIPTEEIDRLENYVIETGIRGKKAWQERFTKKTRAMVSNDAADEGPLLAINHTRETFITQVDMITEKKKDKASQYVERLYDFLVAAKAEAKLDAMSKTFEAQGDATRAKEYAQIYRLVMDLLNQIYQLLGEEEVSLREFVDILTAGLAEIQVGIIPQNVDRILVGDMERTRFKPVKVLFFLGVNDGNIPRNTSKGGILSDVEREFLKDSAHALAPTPRQQMFIQRFYLYLNMTKPKDRLYLSYSRQGSDGKTLRPAYLIDTLKRMFPELTVEFPQDRPILEQVLTVGEGKELLADALRDFAAGQLSKSKEQDFYTLYAAFEDTLQADGACTPQTEASRAEYVKAAFLKHEDRALLQEIAKLVYGKVLGNSVSRLETYAACAYRHFLQYGLSLKEREEFGYEASDLGTVYHGVLEDFAATLKSEHKTWFDFDEDFAERVVTDSLRKRTNGYRTSVFTENERSMYQVQRMGRIMKRTVMTLQGQLKKGSFVPCDFEEKFDRLIDLGEIQGEPVKMSLMGRIDRVDLAEDDGNVYVKVMDYKSGDKKVDLTALYHGLQMQLVVYVNEALQKAKKAHPDKEVVPAAILYYHLADPVVEEKKEMTEEELEHELRQALCAKGIVNDSMDVIRLLDSEFEEQSEVIPVKLNKNGSFSKKGTYVQSKENLELISEFVSEKVKSLGKEILAGNIALSPYERGEENACKYCPYSKACGFDAAIPGCQQRIIKDQEDEEIIELIRKEGGADHE